MSLLIGSYPNFQNISLFINPTTMWSDLLKHIPPFTFKKCLKTLWVPILVYLHSMLHECSYWCLILFKVLEDIVLSLLQYCLQLYTDIHWKLTLAGLMPNQLLNGRYVCNMLYASCVHCFGWKCLLNKININVNEDIYIKGLTGHHRVMNAGKLKSHLHPFTYMF